MEIPGDHTSRSKRTRRALRQDLPHKTSPESLPMSACLSKSTEVFKRFPSPRLLSQVPRELILLLVLLVLCFRLDFEIQSLSGWKVSWTVADFPKKAEECCETKGRMERSIWKNNRRL